MLFRSAVGVTKSQKTTSRDLNRKPTVSLKDLMMSTVLGEKDEDTITTIASRFLRLDKIFTEQETAKVIEKAGKPLNLIAADLLNAFDEDIILDVATEQFGSNPTPDEYTSAKNELIENAIKPLYDPDFRNFIIEAKKAHDQIIDSVNIDSVTLSGWDKDHSLNAEKIISTFKQFIEDNKNKITALEIIYNQSYKTRPLTFKMIEELYTELQKAPYNLNNQLLWDAYGITNPKKVKSKRIDDKLADIISILRFELHQTKNLTLFSADVNIRFKTWVFSKNAGHGQFTDEQMEWLQMIRDHIAVSEIKITFRLSVTL